MIVNMKQDYSLRGYSLEYTSRIMLRRIMKNNFIFQTCRFDTLTEIISKYRIKAIDKTIINLLKFLSINWNKFDLIEFNLNNKEERILIDINRYEVKTKTLNTKNTPHEVCLSNFKFFNELKNNYFKQIILISVVLLENWTFSLGISIFDLSKVKVYSRYKK